MIQKCLPIVAPAFAETQRMLLELAKKFWKFQEEPEIRHIQAVIKGILWLCHFMLFIYFETLAHRIQLAAPFTAGHTFIHQCMAPQFFLIIIFIFLLLLVFNKVFLFILPPQSYSLSSHQPSMCCWRFSEERGWPEFSSRILTHPGILRTSFHF